MKKLFIITALLACSSMQLNAQTVLVSSASGNVPKNYIKTNLTSIFIKNYSLQYERVLNKTISIAVAYRNMPNTSIPFKDQIIKMVDSDDATTEDAINSLTMSNYAITPEVRFYLGKKGYGRGFYIAPFYRYAKYDVANVVVNLDVTVNEILQQRSIILDGKITANTGGLMFGAQWALSKHICLDWWILGPHFGVSSGDLTGIPDPALTELEQIEL
ncbi:MAG: DUF3575 domain-containing protein, partial [Rikenellaceae bacterium]